MDQLAEDGSQLSHPPHSSREIPRGARPETMSDQHHCVPLTLALTIDIRLQKQGPGAESSGLCCRAVDQVAEDGSQLSHPPKQQGHPQGDREILAQELGDPQGDQKDQADPSFVADYLRKLRMDGEPQQQGHEAGTAP